MDAYFWLDGHGRSFLVGRSFLERRSWTLIFGRMLMDGHF